MDTNTLKDLWQSYDNKLAANIRLNKEVLKYILIKKPIRSINLMKYTTIIRLLLPAIILLLFFRVIEFRNEVVYYLGISTLVVLIILQLFWTLRYLVLLNRVNFNEPVIQIRRMIVNLEHTKLIQLKWGYMLSPVSMLAVLLLMDIDFIQVRSWLPLVLMVIVFFISAYLSFKITHESFKKITRELDYIETLERE